MNKRLLPIERAARETTDRRYRFEAKMKREGFVKTTVWVPLDCAEDFRFLAKLLGSTNGALREELRRFCREGKPE